MGIQSSRRRRITLGVAILALLVGYAVYFPGRTAIYAFQIGTGVNLGPLQARIDVLEEKAIAKGDFSEDDKAFLRDLYKTLARGARLLIVLKGSADLVDHYLGGSGTPFELPSSIFTKNERVAAEMAKLSAEAREAPGVEVTSATFYMPHRSSPDSVFALYYGTVKVVATKRPDGKVVARWRAEVPWTWPSYESLAEKHGDPHAESFPIPNLKVGFCGTKCSLFIDNGLGEYLTRIGLAKSFVSYAEWQEVL